MAKIQSHFIGEANWNADHLVEAWRNGKYYVRTQPTAINEPKTPAQLRQREQLALIMGLFKRIKPFLRAGFAGSRFKGNGYTVNRAVSFNVRNAIRQDDSGDQYLDYRSLRVSEGDFILFSSHVISTL